MLSAPEPGWWVSPASKHKFHVTDARLHATGALGHTGVDLRPDLTFEWVENPRALFKRRFSKQEVPPPSPLSPVLQGHLVPPGRVKTQVPGAWTLSQLSSASSSSPSRGSHLTQWKAGPHHAPVGCPRGSEPAPLLQHAGWPALFPVPLPPRTGAPENNSVACLFTAPFSLPDHGRIMFSVN